MNRKSLKQKQIRIWIGAAALLAVGLLIGIICKIVPYETLDTPALARLSFQGTYQYDEDASAIPYEQGMVINANKQDTLILKGYLNQGIAKDVQMLFYIEYLEVQVFQGDTLLYSFGEAGSYPPIMQSKGCSWGHFVMPQTASKDEEWTFVLKNRYQNNYTDAYTAFMKSLCIGDQGVLVDFMLQRNMLYLVSGILFTIFGVALLLICLLLRLRKVTLLPSVWIGGLYMVFMSLNILLNPLVFSLLLDCPTFLMFADTFLVLLSSAFLLLYIRCFCLPKGQKFLSVCFVGGVFTMLLFLFLQFTGIVDAFAIRRYLIFFYFMCAAAALIVSIIEYRKIKNRMHRHVFTSVITLIAFYVLEAVNYGMELIPESFFMTLGFIFFMLIQAYLAIKNIEAGLLAARQMAEMERKLTESRISVMLSQIQPHFLYNALNTIRHLCLTKPELAGSATENFAKYLRANMDSLKQNTPVPFTMELEHLKHYLFIEQLRFDNIQIVYDLGVTDFSLPALTIQPIVENAVKYGVTQEDEGGTITISTTEHEHDFCICIQDDGVGFDPQEKKSDGRSHIGLENTRERLSSICGGTLKIISQKGIGTMVTISIPKPPTLT